MLDRIAAGATDADNFNHGAQSCIVKHIDFHDISS
ncbi:hypothetical protein CFU_3937 [Collimonas fungivorans Ter331]|uniref:Uncharacterized protein n=1 Tax=Collimonas fungivorans (strain Ter331) TaxID=1005048 RepID=G0ADY7_COLFT|nr:hypothetical protein CFU_3937 [Collimonas fungivorans Ter331]